MYVDFIYKKKKDAIFWYGFEKREYWIYCRK